ncbi:MAG: hypothetical protein IT548_03555 [Alphaproteobacteria bacterium]|nr:hypothetical protein [Alphaproteobacteria bacterium]
MNETITLRTERLILRPPVEADLEGYAALTADAEAARFIGGVRARSEAWEARPALAPWRGAC